MELIRTGWTPCLKRAYAKGGNAIPKTMCLKCHRLTDVGTSYCSGCAPKRRPKPKSRTTTERGLGWGYQKARAVVLSLSRRCCLCGKDGANSADHVLPRKRGGSSHPTNLIPSHLSCNSSRQHKPLTQKQIQRAKQFQEENAGILQSE